MNTRVLLAIAIVLGLAGCATTHSGQSASDLQLRVSDLEKQIEVKDNEIKDLKYSLKDMSYELDRSRAQKTRTSSAKGSGNGKFADYLRVNISIEQLQQALKAAGYYDGVVDGKFGNRTRIAIAKFQKDRGLKADGIVGEKTWNELKGHAKTQESE